MHKPIQFKDLGLSFPHKTCFSDFSGQILYGSRIATLYPGAMLVVSHDEHFLKAIGIETNYLIRQGRLQWVQSSEETL